MACTAKGSATVSSAASKLIQGKAVVVEERLTAQGGEVCRESRLDRSPTAYDEGLASGLEYAGAGNRSCRVG